MLSATTTQRPDEIGLGGLRQALLGGFARPSGSIDLSLRELAILLTTVQAPGQDLTGLAASTGLTREAVRRGADCLRRAGLLAGVRVEEDGRTLLSPTPRGEQIVQDMARGMRAGAEAQPLARPRAGQVAAGGHPDSGGL